MPNRLRYTFYIDAAERAALAAIKDRDGISESEQIRRAIAAWIEAREAGTKTARRRGETRKRA